MGEEFAGDEGSGEAEGTHDVQIPPLGRWFSTQDRISVTVAVAPVRERSDSAQWVGISDLGETGTRLAQLLSQPATSGFPVGSLIARHGVIMRGQQ